MRRIRLESKRVGVAIVLALLAAACSKGSSTSSSPAPGSSASYLTVDAYCSSFCGKLCGTCGTASCSDSCKPRCAHGRAPSMLLDGKDPKVALALTQKELDACLATITPASCAAIASGQVPPACFTIQH